MTKREILPSLFWAFVMLALACSPLLAQQINQDGPLGLTWGASADQVRALGIELKDIPQTDYGVTYIATKLPKVLSDQEGTIISFGYNDMLWRIVVISKVFSNDPSGVNIKARYQELVASLEEKYGKPSSSHHLGDSIYGQSRYFLAGLHGGQSSWFSNFSTPSLAVQIGLSAESSSDARWRIFFEEKALKKTFDIAKKAKEKNAL